MLDFMKHLFGFALACSLPACGPTVEIAEQNIPENHPSPVTCTPGQTPTFGAIERREITPKPAVLGPIVLDPKKREALLIGGLSGSGVYANRISVLNIDTFEHHEVVVMGDSVKLPALAVPVWDPENSRAIVLGGTSGGPDLPQVFAVSIVGEKAVVKRLSDYPAGPLYAPAAAYDPLRKRVLVTAFIHSDEPTELAYRATYALDLKSAEDTWSELVPAEMGPPQVEGGEIREMIYDPPNDRMILAATGEKADPSRVWTLDLQNPTLWVGLSGTLNDQSFFTPSIVWDEPSCSMLYLTPSASACSAEMWHVDPSRTDVTTTLLGTAKFDPVGPHYGTILRDSEKDRLLILGGTNCDWSQSFSTAVDVVSMKR